MDGPGVTEQRGDFRRPFRRRVNEINGVFFRKLESIMQLGMHHFTPWLIRSNNEYHAFIGNKSKFLNFGKSAFQMAFFIDAEGVIGKPVAMEMDKIKKRIARLRNRHELIGISGADMEWNTEPMKRFF
jgi:hypothetical protein